ncbi:hypothetical protein Tco_0261999 [Tanacetum coccineum]
MSTPKFAETHNLVAFFEKPEESNGFEEIIDFLNISSVQYELTVNPTIYTTCIEQFCTFTKAKIVNEERHIQALVDKKKVIIAETSIRSDLKLDDVEGTDCLLIRQTEGSSKRAGDELESDKSKKQKMDEHVEAEKDYQEEAEIKRHIEIVKDDEVAFVVYTSCYYASMCFVEYKIDKDGRMGYFKLIRADGSSKGLHQ